MLKVILGMIAAALIGFAAAAYAGFQARIHAIPYEEMARVKALMIYRGGENAMALSPPIGPETAIPRNNPDTRPSFCWANLAQAPVRVSGPLPESYWSLSIYTPDSLNPYVISDRELAPAERYDFVVARAGQAPAEIPPGARLVEVDADEAAVLLRWYVPTPDDVETIDALRRAGTCAPYIAM